MLCEMWWKMSWISGEIIRFDVCRLDRLQCLRAHIHFKSSQFNVNYIVCLCHICFRLQCSTLFRTRAREMCTIQLLTPNVFDWYNSFWFDHWTSRSTVRSITSKLPKFVSAGENERTENYEFERKWLLIRSFVHICIADITTQKWWKTLADGNNNNLKKKKKKKKHHISLSLEWYLILASSLASTTIV